MSTDRRWAGRAFVVVGFVSTLFAACAKGNQETTTTTEGAGGAPDPTTTTTSGGETGGGGALPSGATGSPCSANDECTSGHCTQVGNKKYCTAECPPDCPKGTYCSIVNGDSLCIPDLGQQCDVCKSSADCSMPTDKCLAAPLGDSFCARDCTTIGLCPNGFTCVNGDTYMGVGTGSGGGVDGGAPDAGGDAGKDAGDAGNGAGDGGTKPSVATKWCVPNGGLSCPCNSQRDGVSHACNNVNSFGKCSGNESCDGKAGKWAGCTAATPVAEACNGKDDNCNTQVDEGDPNALCVANGPPPSHSAWTCKLGTCALGNCDAGWASYPAGPVANGCQCPVEAGEPNGSCATAKDAGTVSDAGGSVLLQGTLSSDNDVDFWKFNTVDTDQFTTNSYHVSIDFTGPTPNTEFVMDVIRGPACSEVPSGAGSSVVSYDWCVDGSTPGFGEAPCGLIDGASHCNNYSSNYYVRVHRKAGATGSCTSYVIKATATGGDACDFSTQCQ